MVDAKERNPVVKKLCSKTLHDGRTKMWALALHQPWLIKDKSGECQTVVRLVPIYDGEQPDVLQRV